MEISRAYELIILGVSNKKVKAYNLKTKDFVLELDHVNATQILVNQDGQRVYTISKEKIMAWQLSGYGGNVRGQGHAG